MPVFQNGFLAVIDADGRTVHVADTDGSVVSSCVMSVPNAAVTRVVAVAESARRVIAAAAGAMDREGRYASLILFADFDGKSVRVVRTSPYAAASLLFLPDGQLLAIGREHDEAFETVDGHDLLRFYGEDGVLTRKALRVNQIWSKRDERRIAHPLAWRVGAGTDRIGLLDQERLLYTEFDQRGSIVRALGPLGLEQGLKISGAAILGNGDRLVSVQRGDAFQLYSLRDNANGAIGKREVDLELPEGVRGGMVLGVHKHHVALLSVPPDRVLIVRQPV